MTPLMICYALAFVLTLALLFELVGNLTDRRAEQKLSRQDDEMERKSRT